MKNRTPEEIARLVGYLAGIAVGVLLIVLGALRGDWQLIGAGLPLVGVSALASRHVPATATIERADEA